MKFCKFEPWANKHKFIIVCYKLDCFTWEGSNLACKQEDLEKLERPVRDKHSSLLQTFINYSHKKKFKEIHLKFGQGMVV